MINDQNLRKFDNSIIGIEKKMIRNYEMSIYKLYKRYKQYPISNVGEF